jgi:ATP-dependent DNA ligase
MLHREAREYDPAMADPTTPREIAAAWQPERAGRRAPKHLGDAIVEPDWGGVRVAASLATDDASLWRNGVEVRVAEELLAALVAAFRAVEAVVEGHLTTMALRSGHGALPALPRVERPPILIPRAVRRAVRDDPFVHARDHESQAAAIEPSVLEALERGEPHAFVATDLLWLDGESLTDSRPCSRPRSSSA